VREAYPGDRRRLQIHVTPHAVDEVMHHITPLAEDVRSLAGTFTDEERRAIGRFLEELTAIIERHARDEGIDI
jgi:DNA-binding MarR family transcriptional regulator